MSTDVKSEYLYILGKFKRNRWFLLICQFDSVYDRFEYYFILGYL